MTNPFSRMLEQEIDWTNPMNLPDIDISQVVSPLPENILQEAKKLCLEDGISEREALNEVVFFRKYNPAFGACNPEDRHILGMILIHERWPRATASLAHFVENGLPAFLFTQDHEPVSINRLLWEQRTNDQQLNPVILDPSLWSFRHWDVFAFEKLHPKKCGLTKSDWHGSRFITVSEAKRRWKVGSNYEVQTLATEFELPICLYRPWAPLLRFYGACWPKPYTVCNRDPKNLLLPRFGLWASERENPERFNFGIDGKRNEMVKTFARDFAATLWRRDPTKATKSVAQDAYNHLMPWLSASFSERAIERWISDLNPCPRRGNPTFTTKAL